MALGTSVPAGTAGSPPSRDEQWTPGIVQSVSPPGTFDLGPGYLEPALLPVGLLDAAYRQALTEFGTAALSYGADQGALPLREALAARAGGRCGPGNVLVTGGISQALQLVSTSMAAPADVVFVDRTSYDLGRRIITDCGLPLREVPGDAAGMDPAALVAAVAAERAAGRRPAFVYLNPTFHNPTGAVMPVPRRRALVSAAAEVGLLIVEDDAYAGLGLDHGELPVSCAELAGYHGVIRLCTFAKTLAPGLRLGWLLADPSLVGRLAGHGMFVSGGCVNHLASLAATVLVRDGCYDRHLRWLRGQLRARRDALAVPLRHQLGHRVDISCPRGGFFLWLRFPDGEREPDLLAAARQAGVVAAAGSRFGTVSRTSLRLAYSFNSPARLTEAASRLGAAWETTAPSS
ncbi:aminotransferase class I/II-fold pyridoxal phosphate-dependent enzyme [Actinophytocola sp.]|uniref:aminotransferase class I/II-fold pyridoxal phosphate-dependent enzyme n=1 Tax=Actinophytocola sp. TaxID=1872138 RepID=UPI002D71F346|nr:aminotransferase class I/II-fold pyridoxal phosphate-dependent enzyme [Actinophytocola sp.]HYQ62596.1 aminotransferase class I/II-fold pyridoxal phosphate-dependent enzyme [Actinophytocola sp.]